MHKRMDKASQANVAAKTPSAYAHADELRQHRARAQGVALPDRRSGIDTVLLGTDYSFPAEMEPLALLKTGLSKSDSDAISDGNARRLFARMK